MKKSFTHSKNFCNLSLENLFIDCLSALPCLFSLTQYFPSENYIFFYLVEFSKISIMPVETATSEDCIWSTDQCLLKWIQLSFL